MGLDFRVNRNGLLHVWQETAGHCPFGLRVGSYDLPIFHFQHLTACRDWKCANGTSLLLQTLNEIFDQPFDSVVVLLGKPVQALQGLIRDLYRKGLHWMKRIRLRIASG